MTMSRVRARNASSSLLMSTAEPDQADRADEQADAGLLVGEDMLATGPDGGLLRIGLCAP